MGDYRTVDRVSEGFYEEKHSRFTAYLYPINSIDDANEKIAEHKKKFWDARHNVYAYVLGDNTARFSDDGEPHGTAGKPVLEVINGEKLSNVLMIVTRYFGGILLGTGGLVRAYTAAAKDAVGNAEILEIVECKTVTLTVFYAEQERVSAFLSDFGALIKGKEYSENVTLEVSVPKDLYEAFSERLNEVLGKTAEISDERIEFLPIREKKQEK